MVGFRQCWWILPSSRVAKTSWTLKMGPIGSPATSVLNHVTPRTNPADGRIQTRFVFHPVQHIHLYNIWGSKSRPVIGLNFTETVAPKKEEKSGPVIGLNFTETLAPKKEEKSGKKWWHWKHAFFLLVYKNSWQCATRILVMPNNLPVLVSCSADVILHRSGEQFVSSTGPQTGCTMRWQSAPDRLYHRPSAAAAAAANRSASTPLPKHLWTFSDNRVEFVWKEIKTISAP